MVKVLGTEVGPIGYGLMGLTWRKAPPPKEQAFAAMKAAINQGAIFWNGGEFYGPPERNSLHLLNEYFTQNPGDADKIILNIKGGVNLSTMTPDGTSEGVRRSMDACLRTLDGKKKIDMFECARVDDKTPIEVTIRALAEYVKEGKLGGIALSEASAETIRRAAKVHPIACVEVEYSLWALEIVDNGVAQACKENNIPIVAYSPLGRGILTGQIKSVNDLPEDDLRRRFPRFQPDVFDTNIKLVDEVVELAKKKGCKPGQLAVGWILKNSGRDGMPEIVPIPGATTEERVQENSKVVELTDTEFEEINAVISRIPIQGDRYPQQMQHMAFRDTPPEK
ncbi:MAG: Pyridoxine 4-dehydrogenase [Bathelium mastoideum]|nr:MAG: Pyridoxine 4-dehydrogenase [Bathelium mastoideum]